MFASPYIRLIALLLVLLNVVNTTGEFILSHMVTVRAQALAAADAAFDKGAYIGAFYGDYFFWVNVAALVLQAFVASRLVKRFGLAGVLFALPLIAIGSYGIIALGASLVVVRWAKTAENSADYSVMNTAKQMMWLPTTPRGEVQGQAGGRRLLLSDRRPGRGGRRIRRHQLARDGLARLRDRQPAVRDRVAAARGARRPREPSPLGRVTGPPARAVRPAQDARCGRGILPPALGHPPGHRSKEET